MNILAEMSLDFAVQIIRLCNSIKGHDAWVNSIQSAFQREKNEITQSAMKSLTG
ncbi:MAG: hypothetical protein IJ060_10745 [Oscillospiraceae bacterium]|nr:hypothetical protein [Oscillospiraceae bacterium]